MSDREQAEGHASLPALQFPLTSSATGDQNSHATSQHDGHNIYGFNSRGVRRGDQVTLVFPPHLANLNLPGELPLLWGYPEQEVITMIVGETRPATPGEGALSHIPPEEWAPPLVVEHAQMLLHNPPSVVHLSILRVLRNAAAGLPSWHGMTQEEIAAAQNDVRDLAEVMNSSLNRLVHIMNWRIGELTGEPHPRGPLDPDRLSVAWQTNDRQPRSGEPARVVRRLEGQPSDPEDYSGFMEHVRARQGLPIGRYSDFGGTAGSSVDRATLHAADDGDLPTPQLQEARAETPDLGDEVWDTEYGHCRRYLENVSGLNQVGVERSGWRELARGLRDSIATTEWFSVLEAVTNIADGVRIFDNTTTAERELLICDLAEFAGAHPGDQIVPLVFQCFLREEEQEVHREEVRARDDEYAERRAWRDIARNRSTRHGVRAELDPHQYEAVRQAREEQINRLLVDLITSADRASDPPATGTTGPRTLLVRLGEGGDLVEIEVSEAPEDRSSGERGYLTDAEIVQDEEAAEDDIELMGLEIGITDLQGLSLSVDIEAMVEAQNELIEDDRLYGPGVDWWRE
ncbi:hypothetical protein LTS10_009307 [Elasticomyces elasticus]|nr:hypothetical protein LTS10_009307 [Elasticomyces elasticus]